MKKLAFMKTFVFMLVLIFVLGGCALLDKTGYSSGPQIKTTPTKKPIKTIGTGDIEETLLAQSKINKFEN